MTLHSSFFNHDAQAGGFNPKSHVGFDIRGFGQSQNMLIEGIRGTGKTHVLKMVEKHCLDTFDSLRVLPIFFSLASISEHTQKPPDIFRQYFYFHLVQRAIEGVERNRKYIQPDKNLLQKALRSLSRMFHVNGEPNFDELLNKLRETADKLVFKLQYDKTEIEEKDGHKEANGSSRQVTGKVTAKIPSIKADIEASGADSRTSEEDVEQTVSYVGKLLSHQDGTSFIIDFLNEIQVILNLEHSLILIDECSEASTQAQIEIFRLFKAIRGSRSKLPGKDSSAFFIGTVYPRGNTYYPNRDADGFEFKPGQDCTMEFLQWDETDIETYYSFFKEMTIRRAREVLKYEKGFEDFLKEYFDDPDAFALAAYCANGIPRRFWEILKIAYDKGSEKILLRGVDNAIQEVTNNQILASTKLTSNDTDFVDHIVKNVTKKNLRGHLIMRYEKEVIMETA